jgi:hypothetical protein
MASVWRSPLQEQNTLSSTNVPLAVTKGHAHNVSGCSVSVALAYHCSHSWVHPAFPYSLLLDVGSCRDALCGYKICSPSLSGRGLEKVCSRFKEHVPFSGDHIVTRYLCYGAWRYCGPSYVHSSLKLAHTIGLFILQTCFDLWCTWGLCFVTCLLLLLKKEACHEVINPW